MLEEDISLLSREDIFEEMENIMRSIAIQFFFWIVRIYNFIEKWLSPWMISNDTLDTLQDKWTSILWIEHEKLHQSHIDSFKQDDSIVEYKNMIRQCKEDLEKKQFPIILMKTEEGYYCNILYEMYKDARLYLSQEEKQAANIKFISVNYIYGEDPEKSVPIDVNRGFYMTGNHLFNATFVYRSLKYQSQPYEFTMNYTLQIVDDSANYFELKSDQYIQVEKDGYIIKKIDSSSEPDE